MTLLYPFCMSPFVACAGCAINPPCSLTLGEPEHHNVNVDVAITDRGTAIRCAENMLNASPADEAVDIQTRVTGTGHNIFVDVSGTLITHDVSAEARTVTYRCTYEGELMTHAT